MTYVMSDIHGCFNQYLKLLKLIGFSADDDLFVLGDVVDWGKQPIEVLRDMSMRANVFPIVGNHEFAAIAVLKQILVKAKFVVTEESLDELITEESEREDMLRLIEDISLWAEAGGGPTMDGFAKLPLDEKDDIIEYLEEFSLYETVDVCGKKYVLTHAGVPEGATLDNLSGYDAFDFVVANTDYGKVYFEDAILVTGHIPLQDGKVWRGNSHIRIDTGSVFGGNLCCVCLNTGEEFYVKGKEA